MTLTRHDVLVTGSSGFIGTNLLPELSALGLTAVGMDLRRPPTSPPTGVTTVVADIMDQTRIREIVDKSEPRFVIHLAARTDTDSDVVADYDVNSTGTRIVAEASMGSARLERFVHTSTQFVVRPGGPTDNPLHFDPHTAYGESKALSESYVRDIEGLPWVIARPTNIWGAWHPRYPHEFWRVLRRRLYVHPKGPRVLRTYGYVGNVVQQFYALLTDPDALHQVIYLGDLPDDLAHWVDAFSTAITGNPARRVPFAVLRALATVGDSLGRAHVTFPLTSSRLRSMTEDYVVPTDYAAKRLTPRPVPLARGVEETVDWLRAGGWGR